MPAAQDVIQFGGFDLDPHKRELRKHGTRLKVSPQTFRVLVLLLENRGAVVTREELCRLLWPGDNRADFEGHLNAVIRDVREVLGDSARQSRFIKTEPKLGYSFIGAVQGEPPLSLPLFPGVTPELKPKPEVKPLDPEASPHVSDRRWIVILAATALVTLAAWFLYSYIDRASGRDRYAVLRTDPITNFTGRASHPSFSPDGSMVAFSWNGSDQRLFQIYVKKLGSEDVAQVARSDANDLNPAWSPDGRDIAFLRKSGNGTRGIYLVPAAGGADRLIAAVPAESTISWAANGRWIAYAVTSYEGSAIPAEDCGIWAVSLVDGQRKRLTGAVIPWPGDASPVFSLDGKWLAFFRSYSTGVNEIFLAGLNPELDVEGTPKRLTFESQNSRDLTWTPDSKQLIFSSRRQGDSSLWRLPIDSAAHEPIHLGGEDAFEAAVDPSGRRVMYSRLQLTDRIRRISLCGSGCPEVPMESKFSLKLARNPSWSPDAHHIAFESSITGRIEVWLCDSDGSNVKLLSAFKSTLTGTARWSPDGKNLAVDSRPGGRSKIFVLPVDGSPPRQLTFGTWDDMIPSWSPDGRWIYFSSNRSGAREIWKVPSAGGTPVRITGHGAFGALAAFDGKLLYYAKGVRSTSIWSVPVDGGEERPVIDSLDYWENFSLSPSGIYFVPKSDRKGIVIQFLPFQSSHTVRSKEVTVAQLDGVNAQGLSASFDDRSVVLSVRESEESNLMLMLLGRGGSR